MNRTVCRLEQVSVSLLSREIWQASTRGVCLDSVWTGYSKKVLTQSPFLTPRDVSMILESYSKIKYRDDKLLTHLVPTLIKYMGEFSVREIVSILSSMKKLEFSRIDCIHLFVNQLVLRKREWNAMDCALIANSLSWFRVFDEKIWKAIELNVRKNWRELQPIGMSLLVGALARLDMRNELMLDLLTRAVMYEENIWSQETLAVLVNGFAKLSWDKMGLFENCLIPKLEMILLNEPNAFDQQSIVLLLHALCGYRKGLYPESLVKDLISKISPDRVLSPDQAAKLSLVAEILPLDFPVIVNSRIDGKKKIKLPRWEYEIFRILKDTIGAQIYRKHDQEGKTRIYIRPVDNDGEVCLLCLGPFQHYTGSTKRTAASILGEEILRRRGKRVITVPYYVWNELKTDDDRVMYLLSLGRLSDEK